MNFMRGEPTSMSYLGRGGTSAASWPFTKTNCYERERQSDTDMMLCLKSPASVLLALALLKRNDYTQTLLGEPTEQHSSILLNVFTTAIATLPLDINDSRESLPHCRTHANKRRSAQVIMRYEPKTSAHEGEVACILTQRPKQQTGRYALITH